MRCIDCSREYDGAICPACLSRAERERDVELAKLYRQAIAAGVFDAAHRPAAREVIRRVAEGRGYADVEVANG